MHFECNLELFGDSSRLDSLGAKFIFLQDSGHAVVLLYPTLDAITLLIHNRPRVRFVRFQSAGATKFTEDV
jgi:hypothetical protein